MIVKYDKRAMAIRLVLGDPANYSYSEEITDYVIIDRDKEGNVIAVEILGVDGIEDYEGREYRLVEK